MALKFKTFSVVATDLNKGIKTTLFHKNLKRYRKKVAHMQGVSS